METVNDDLVVRFFSEDIPSTREFDQMKHSKPRTAGFRLVYHTLRQVRDVLIQLEARSLFFDVELDKGKVLQLTIPDVPSFVREDLKKRLRGALKLAEELAQRGSSGNTD